MGEIQYIDRISGQVNTEQVPGEKWLHWLYNKPLGKLSLHTLLKRKLVSVLAGKFMDTGLSRKQIGSFILNNQINLSAYKKENVDDYKSFNDFFYREIKEEEWQIEPGFVSPSDGKLLAFQDIDKLNEFFVKGSAFNLKRYLNSEKLAKKYAGGSMLIIRLAPVDYHRFHFPTHGFINKPQKIKGKYFSVSPLALKKSLQIFCENHRTYSILQTVKYGDIVYSEVGASLVGSIQQTYKAFTEVKKGQEKGYFAFGGSTLVLFFEKGKINFNEDLIRNTSQGLETKVQMGEQIAC